MGVDAVRALAIVARDAERVGFIRKFLHHRQGQGFGIDSLES